MKNDSCYRAAVIQMNSADELAVNLEQAADFIAAAASKQCKLVVLPENFTLMGRQEEDKLALREDFANSGVIQSFLAGQAHKHHIYLSAGTVPFRGDDPERMRAANLLYDPAGKCIARYDKLHLFDVLADADSNESYCESATIEPGDKVVTVATSCGILGLSVCYDLRFPELYRHLMTAGAQVFIVAAAFTATTGKAHWETLLRARAIENLAYVIASNQTGVHANQRATWGHSMIVAPWGEIIASLDSAVGMVYADIDLAKQQRQRQCFPCLDHRLPSTFYD